MAVWGGLHRAMVSPSVSLGTRYLFGPRVGNPAAVSHQVNHREVDPLEAAGAASQRRHVPRVDHDLGAGDLCNAR